MKRLFGISAISGLMALLIVACGGNNNSTEPEPVTGDTIFVDVNSSGTPDGSSANPYNTLTAAIDAAKAGDVINIAAGEYADEETFPIDLKPGLTLQGENSATTLIRGLIRDISQNNSLVVLLKDLYCEEFTFGRNAAPDTPSGINTLLRCEIDGDVGSLHGGGHNFTVDSCEVTGDVTFGHGNGDCRDAVRWSDVEGLVRFGSGEANTTDGLVQVITNCHVGDGINFNSGMGGVDTVLNCEIDSAVISYKSGESNAYIAYNIIAEGRILDMSGSGDQFIFNNTITCTGLGLEEDSACVYAAGASDYIDHNIITASNGVSGIWAISGYPTIIDSNTVDVTGGGHCLFTESAAGYIVGNSLTGGSVGLSDSSAALLVAYNEIENCGTGIIVHSAARYLENTVTGCTGDGMIVEYSGQAIDSNTVIDNGGAGVRVIDADTDFGGGQYSGFGGNTFAGNTAWDLVNESADTVWAKYNFWDHSDSASVDTEDIYDQEEDASSGPVMFMPLGQ
jgi:hypothetical protein